MHDDPKTPSDTFGASGLGAFGDSGRAREGDSISDRPALRAWMLAAVLLTASLAGCAKDEEPVAVQEVVPGRIAGTVTDVALLPLAGAQVSVEGTNLTATTDAAGGFGFELPPGDYVVLASLAEHKPGALRASVVSAGIASLAFSLEPIPRIVPRVDVAEGSGFVACAMMLDNAGTRTDVACGENDPNARTSLEFGLSRTVGFEGVVVELVWEPATAGDALSLVVSKAGEEPVELARAEGSGRVAITLPPRLVEGVDALRVDVGSAGGLTDDEATVDAGLALQQGFSIYVSQFYNQQPAAGYTALQEG